MGGKSQPDFGNVAAAEGEASRDVVRDQLYANRPTQYSPWGFTDWQSNLVTDPATGKQTTEWTQTTGLTPELQSILDKQLAVQGGRTDIAGGLTDRLGSEFGQKMDFSGLTPYQHAPTAQLTMPESFENAYTVGDPSRLRQRAEQGYMDKVTSRLQPQFDSRRQAMEIKLRNQGLSPGDEAYNAQMQAIDQQETDAFGQAQYDAIRAGLGEQQQLFGQDMSLRGQDISEAMQQYGMASGANQQNFNQMLQGSGFQNQLRQSQLAESMQQRGFSLNEINALLSGQQVGMPSMPSFNTAGQAQVPSYTQAAAQQASMENATNPWASIGSLAGTLGGAALGNPALF